MRAALSLAQVQVCEQVGQRGRGACGPDGAEVQAGQGPAIAHFAKSHAAKVHGAYPAGQQCHAAAACHAGQHGESPVGLLRHMGFVACLAQRVEDAGMQHGQLGLRVHDQPGLGDLRQADLAVLADLEFVGHGGHQALAQQLRMRPPTATGVCMSMAPVCRASACSALLISRRMTRTPGACCRSARRARAGCRTAPKTPGPR